MPHDVHTVLGRFLHAYCYNRDRTRRTEKATSFSKELVCNFLQDVRLGALHEYTTKRCGGIVPVF